MELLTDSVADRQACEMNDFGPATFVFDFVRIVFPKTEIHL